MTATPPSARGRLIFQWPERNASFAFPLLFLGAVAIHGLAFFGFQVIYPPVTTMMPPAGQVTLISASSPANATLLEWINLQNPAKAPRIEEIVPSGLGEIAYVPSYATVQTLPKPASAATEGTSFPPAYNALSLLAPAASPREKRQSAARSSLTFSQALKERDAGKGWELASSSRSKGNLLPSIFLVGIGDRGEVQYTFLQNSSGDRAMDEEAERVLLGYEFSRKEGASAVWGFATFTWGADAFAPSESAASSTPQAP